METMMLADGREISEYYTPEQVKDWLTPKMGPDGVETFESYNNLHPVRLAESFVIYADRTLKRIKELEEMRSRAVSVEMMAERAWRHGYELDPAELLEALTGSYPSEQPR